MSTPADEIGIHMAIADLVERLAIVLRTEVRQAAAAHGLAPVQLEALRYLAACNRFSDTPAVVAEYLGTTPGTMSQTLLALERKGLVVKRPDDADGRKIHCVLTDAGRAIVDEIGHVVLPPGVPDDAETVLRDLLTALQRARGGRSFGVCRTCRFHRVLPDGDRCGLTHEPLSPYDGTRICREHGHREHGHHPDGGHHP